MNVATPYVEFARKAFARSATYRFEVFTDVGSFLLRIYLLRCLWTALYAQNAAPTNLPLHAIITYSTVALLMSLILEVDGTPPNSDARARRLDRDRPHEADQLATLLLQRRPGRDDLPRIDDLAVARTRAAARAGRRAVAADALRVSPSRSHSAIS